MVDFIADNIFRNCGSAKRKPSPSGSMRLCSLDWWALKLWNDNPGVFPLRIKMDYDINTANPPSRATRLRENVDYEAMITAETGRLFGTIRQTGSVTISLDYFRVQWSPP